jgi:hypothetical protein
MAVYAGLGINAVSISEIMIVLLGVFLGSAIWWLSLSFGTFFLKQKLTQSFLNKFSKSAALIVGFFGAIALARTLMVH